MIDPEDLVRDQGIDGLNRAADAYFRARLDPEPQMAKPFSSPLDAPEVLANLGLLLGGLHLGKTMRVLDFGAGSCWLSRCLTQLGCRAVACDVSPTALDIGRRLFAEHPVIGEPVAGPEFLLFDGRRIDLPDASVDRIACNDAFHHVPNQDEVMAELFRVLKEGGIAGFVEPGRHHSQGAQSQYEMANFGVLERDVVAGEIDAMARRAGFTQVVFSLLCEGAVNLDRHRSLVAGAPDEAAEREVLDRVAATLARKTIFFLHKGAFVPDSRTAVGLARTLAAAGGIRRTAPHGQVAIDLTLTNTGGATWLHENVVEIGIVRVGSHLRTASGELVSQDYTRHGLPRAVPPGESLLLPITVPFYEPGDYRLVLDLVSEEVCWFEYMGSAPLEIVVSVR